MTKNVKIKLTQDELEEIIGTVIQELFQHKNAILIKDVMSECLNNYIICEGLIKSFSYNDVKKVLNNKSIKKYGITLTKVPFYLYKNKYEEQSCQIFMNFTLGLENIDYDLFNNILQIMDNLGWYFSVDSFGSKNLDYEKLKLKNNFFYLVFEPKFDVLLSSDEIPHKLYHITRKSIIDKVIRQHKGLTPKNNCMTSNHPERVYMLMNKPDKWTDIANYYRKLKGVDEKFCLLEIDGDGLNKSNKVYIDQNSNIRKACFTLEPVPSLLIKVIDEE